MKITLYIALAIENSRYWLALETLFLPNRFAIFVCLVGLHVFPHLLFQFIPVFSRFPLTDSSFQIRVHKFIWIIDLAKVNKCNRIGNSQ